MADNTRDIFQFSESAKARIAPLMSAYSDPNRNLTIHLGTFISIEWNPDSDFVFLINANFRVALLNHKGDLCDWYRCDCGCEGFYEHLKDSGQSCCQAFLAQEMAKVRAA